MTASLEWRNVRVQYELNGRRLVALDDVSLAVERGRSLGLVGESGSGKSSLARALFGFAPLTSGSILIDGRERKAGAPLAEQLAIARTVQMLFQDSYASLDPRLDVEALIGEPLEIHGVATERERRARTFALLEAVGLSTQHLRRFPHEFSGGQRQRLALARALALEPQFLVLDEPTSALDVSIRAQVLNLLTELAQRFELTLVVISHDLAVVRHLCREVAVMYAGRIVERASAESFFAAPRHPYSAALIASSRELDLAPIAGAAAARRAVAGDPPSPFATLSGCSFHPRCPERERIGARCANEVPQLRALEREPGRSAACHLNA